MPDHRFTPRFVLRRDPLGAGLTLGASVETDILGPEVDPPVVLMPAEVATLRTALDTLDRVCADHERALEAVAGIRLLLDRAQGEPG